MMCRKARLVLLAGALLGTSGLLMAQVAPSNVYEIEGNSKVDGTICSAFPAFCDDWDLLNGTGGPSSVPPGNGGAPGNSLARAFISEPAGGQIFTGGSTKDPKDVSQWKWTTGAVPDKDLFTNGYVALYQVNNEEIVAFGADRFAVNGDANIGIWFFQDNVNPLPDGSFGPGVHKLNDIFVLSAFTIGGTQPGVSVFRWNPACLKAWKNPAPGSPPSSCADTNLEVLFASSNVCGSNSPACAKVNGIGTLDADAAGAITVSWPYATKFGGAVNTIPAGGFYEGGVNLTALLGNVPCFTHVLSETRSSQSTDAVLKDFLAGNLNFCGSVAINKNCETATKIEDSPDVIRYVFDGVVSNTSAGGLSLFNAKVTDTYPSGSFTITNKVLRCGGTVSNGVCSGGTLGTANPDGTVSCTIGSIGPQPATEGYCGSFDSNTILGSNTINHVDVAAATSPNGAQTIDNDPGTGDWPAACSITLTPGLLITKTCNTTIDQNQNGHIVIGVDFSGTVCNTGDVDVTGITASDSTFGALPLSTTSLEPGACATFGVPNPLHTQPPSCNAGSDGRCAISNTVSASGTGGFNTGSVVATPVSATCRVCPSGVCSNTAP